MRAWWMTGLAVAVVGMMSVRAADEPKAEPLDQLLKGELVKADGTKVQADSLKGKMVGVYFSAHWCPPCRTFTPKLVEFYNDVVKTKKDFEIVFVSSDRSPEAMKEYMTGEKMPWLALPHKDERGSALSKKWNVAGIPTFVVVAPDGRTISTKARGDVQSKGAKAIDDWK